MNCHGLANVNDKEGPCVKEGKFLILEDIESHRFFCAVIPVSTPDCRTRLLPWNYAPINQVFTSSLPASVQYDAEPWSSGCTPEVIL